MQLAEGQAAPRKGVVTGLCMECAIRHHDDGEMLRHDTD
jgi:hypothetical protein